MASATDHAEQPASGPGRPIGAATDPLTRNAVSNRPDDEVTIMMLKPLDRRDDGGRDDDPLDDTIVVEPQFVNDRAETGRQSPSGRWLPLRDAVREVGSLERLYLLAHAGSLESREDQYGQIEVWIATSECYAAPDPSADAERPSVDAEWPAVDAERPSVDAARPRDAATATGPDGSEVGQAAAALIAPLAEAHARQLEFARENGALSQRLAALERELQDMRAQAAVNLAPLAEAHARQIELARENGALAERVAGLQRALDDARSHVSQAGQAVENGVASAEAHERHLHLAHENGALSNRRVGLERELEQARARASGREAPLAEARERALRLAQEREALSERIAALEREPEAAPASSAKHVFTLAAADPRPHRRWSDRDASGAGAVSRELALDDQPARQAATVADASQPLAKRSGGAGYVLLLILGIIAIVAISMGAGWMAAFAP